MECQILPCRQDRRDMGLFKKRAEESQETQTTKEEEILFANLSDDFIDFDTAMKIPAFAACINMIANTVSMIPIKLYKKENDTVKELKDDYRVKMLNEDPKDSLSAVDMKRQLVCDYFERGGYLYIERHGNTINSLRYVDNREIKFRYSEDPIFKDYKIMVRGTYYEPFDFVKVLRSTKNGWESRSIVEENKELLLVAYNSILYEKNLVKTGGNKKGFIKSAKKLSEEAIKALKAAWRKLYQNNSENVVILNDGLDFKESSNSCVELQLNENKKSNDEEICKIFNVPSEMFSQGKNSVQYIQYCIVPILNVIKTSLNRDLLLESEKDSCFFDADYSELTKADIKTRYEAYGTAIEHGFLQIDDVRTMENKPKLGLNFIKLGLQDVIYNVKTNEFYIPNMNANGGIGKAGKDVSSTVEK